MATFSKSLLPLLQPFRQFWLGNLSLSIGGMIQTVGAAWLMTTMTASADMVTLVTAASAMSILMFSALSGAIADNFERRNVMLVAQAGMLVMSILLVVFAALGWLNPWLLLAFTLLIGVGTALNTPSWQASLADLVPREQLPAAVALNGIGTNITRGIGPAVGGAVVAAFGPIAAFILNAASYLPLIAVLLRWKPPERAKALPPESIVPAVAAGLRYMALSPHLQALALRSFIFGLAAVPVLALLPVIVRDQFGGNALLYGLLFGAYGLGGILGAFASTWARERISSEWTIRLSFAGFACCTLLLATVPPPWLAAISLVIGGFFWVVALALFSICVQLSTPRWVVGRVLSLYHMASFGGQALGAWIAGLLAQSLGLSAALLGASATLAFGFVIGMGRLALATPSMPNLDPTNRWQHPELSVPLTPRSGPVRIAIDYHIPQSRLTEFLTTMVERRRTRRRDGARDWLLHRDLQDGELWTESYWFPTWLDYLRCNNRITQADNHIGDALRRLHEGPTPPVVRRSLERDPSWRGGSELPPTAAPLE
jgi:MFS family permease